MKLSDSVFINNWKKETMNSMKLMNPSWTNDQMEKVLNKMINEKFNNPKVSLDNNVTKEHKESTLLSVLDWVEKRKPIIAGNGTFYKNQDEAINPTGLMLDDILDTRKSIKKHMFSLEEGSDEYSQDDREQSNEKVNVNGYYGASGMPGCAFYSKWSAPATTLTAQSIISTTMNTFEAFCADNFRFLDIDECLHWIHTILSEQVSLDPWVKIIDGDSLLKRLKHLFNRYDNKYDEILKDIVINLSPEDRTIIYYKNQLKVFITDHKQLKSLYNKIFKNVKNYKKIEDVSEIPDSMRSKYKTIKEYNKWIDTESFMNPDEIPSNVFDDVTLFKNVIIKYTYTSYLVFDRINRLKTFKRGSVVAADTDSNMISCGEWVDFTMNDVISSDNQKSRDTMENVFIAVNMYTSILTDCIKDILYLYATQSYIPENYRGRFKMKNEFLFIKLYLCQVKKRYLSSIILREGNRYNPLRIDIKGHDFMKSSTSETVSEYFSNVVTTRFLGDDDPDPLIVYNDLKELRDTIYNSIHNGSKEYLPIKSVKEVNAYANPFSQQGVRGIYAWNAIYPNMPIEAPAKINIVKMNIFKESDIDGLKDTHPEIHDVIIKKIFNNRNKDISSKGLQVLAVPPNEDIPVWARDYIDYPTIINNIMNQFASVTDTLGMQTQPVGKTISNVNRKTELLTNIVRI